MVLALNQGDALREREPLHGRLYLLQQAAGFAAGGTGRRRDRVGALLNRRTFLAAPAAVAEEGVSCDPVEPVSDHLGVTAALRWGKCGRGYDEGRG